MRVRFVEARPGEMNLKDKTFGIQSHRPVKSSDTRFPTEYLESDKRELSLTNALNAGGVKSNILMFPVVHLLF